MTNFACISHFTLPRSPRIENSKDPFWTEVNFLLMSHFSKVQELWSFLRTAQWSYFLFGLLKTFNCHVESTLLCEVKNLRVWPETNHKKIVFPIRLVYVIKTAPNMVICFFTHRNVFLHINDCNIFLLHPPKRWQNINLTKAPPWLATI